MANQEITNQTKQDVYSRLLPVRIGCLAHNPSPEYINEMIKQLNSLLESFIQARDILQRLEVETEVSRIFTLVKR